MLDSLILIQYKGGRCGEFLTNLVGQSDGVQTVTTTSDVNTNTYYCQDPLREYLKTVNGQSLSVIQSYLKPGVRTVTSTFYIPSNDSFVLDRLKVFQQNFLAHGAAVVVAHSETHNLFFDCLQMIKHWFKIMPTGQQRWRTEFPQYQNITDFLRETGLAATGESLFNQRLISKLGVPVLDLDQLFFERRPDVFANWLASLNLRPAADYASKLADYHQRNLDLAEKYAVPLNVNQDAIWFEQWCQTHSQ